MQSPNLFILNCTTLKSLQLVLTTGIGLLSLKLSRLEMRLVYVYARSSLLYYVTVSNLPWISAISGDFLFEDLVWQILATIILGLNSTTGLC